MMNSKLSNLDSAYFITLIVHFLDNYHIYRDTQHLRIDFLIPYCLYKPDKQTHRHITIDFDNIEIYTYIIHSELH